MNNREKAIIKAQRIQTGMTKIQKIHALCGQPISLHMECSDCCGTGVTDIVLFRKFTTATVVCPKCRGTGRNTSACACRELLKTKVEELQNDL